MLWEIYSISAALCWASATLVDKYVLSKRIKNPYIPVMVFGIIGLTLGIFIYFARGYQALSPVNLLLSFAAALGYVLATVFYFHAVRIEEASRISALAYLSPLFILILAGTFLGEIFTPLKYAGIFLILIGAILISAKDITKLKFGMAFFLMILSALSLAVNAVLTKYLLGFADYWTIFAYTRGIWVFVALIPLIYFNFKGFRNMTNAGAGSTLGIISLSGALTFLGSFLITIAESLGPVSLVITLSSIRPFFVLFFAVILSLFHPEILREETGKSAILAKLLAIALMFSGVVLIT